MCRRNRCALTRSLLLLSIGYFLALNLNFAHRETPITQTLECKSCAAWCAACKELWKRQTSGALPPPLQSGHWRCFTHAGWSQISLQKGLYSHMGERQPPMLMSAWWILQQISLVCKKKDGFAIHRPYKLSLYSGTFKAPRGFSPSHSSSVVTVFPQVKLCPPLHLCNKHVFSHTLRHFAYDGFI